MEINRNNFEKFEKDYKRLTETLGKAAEITKTLDTFEKKLLKDFAISFEGKYFKIIDRIRLKEEIFFKVEKINIKKDFEMSGYMTALVLELRHGFTLQDNRTLNFSEVFEAIEITKEEFEDKILMCLKDSKVLFVK